MKIFSRDFSIREKILLLFLALILVFFTYYKLVDEPIRSAMEESIMNTDALNYEMELLQAKVIDMKEKEDELAKIKGREQVSRMESYNASRQEVDFLNQILNRTEEYKISFEDASRTRNQVRRSFSLNYVSRDYESAQAVLENLYRSELRCLVEDVRITDKDNNEDLKDGFVSVSLNATFYETMAGGTADAGLQQNES